MHLDATEKKKKKNFRKKFKELMQARITSTSLIKNTPGQQPSPSSKMLADLIAHTHSVKIIQYIKTVKTFKECV